MRHLWIFNSHQYAGFFRDDEADVSSDCVVVGAFEVVIDHSFDAVFDGDGRRAATLKQPLKARCYLS